MKEELYYSPVNNQLLVRVGDVLYSEERIIFGFPQANVEAFIEENGIVYIGEL